VHCWCHHPGARPAQPKITNAGSNIHKNRISFLKFLLHLHFIKKTLVYHGLLQVTGSRGRSVHNRPDHQVVLLCLKDDLFTKTRSTASSAFSNLSSSQKQCLGSESRKEEKNAHENKKFWVHQKDKNSQVSKIQPRNRDGRVAKSSGQYRQLCQNDHYYKK